jgi:hypothetical protein
MSPVIDTAKSLLEIAKALYSVIADPYAGIMGAVVASLEDLVNDYFGAGGHLLVVDNFAPILQPKNKKDKKDKKDKYGIPLLAPGTAINIALSSLDDLGDPSRPVYSNSAQISAFGFMLTAIDFVGFYELMKALQNVWSIDELKFNIKKFEQFEKGFSQSVPPNWKATKYNDIEQVAKLQKNILKMLNQTRGYLVTADQAVIQLIDSFVRKADQLKASADGIASILRALSAIAAMNDVWAFDVPLTTGGTEKLKEQLFSDQLAGMKLNKYTFLVLYVGGGPNAPVIDNIRQLIM